MDLLVAFAVFVVVIIISLLRDITIIVPLLCGLAAFGVVAVKRGYRPGEVVRMAAKGTKKALIITKVMLVIGALTALWRASGTISIFIEYGVRAISPHMFLMIAFLLTCLLSYALGTCFGVGGTAGVIFIALARSGGVDPLIAAGVIMSGLLFGDRGSPVSSMTITASAVTDTDLMDNIRKLFKTAVVPFAVTLVCYAVLSWRNPIGQVDETLLEAMRTEHVLSLWAFIPAVLILVLPLIKVGVMWAMTASVVAAAVISAVVQGFSVGEIIKIALIGYSARVSEMESILNGGGAIPMLFFLVMLMIACGISGIFEDAHLLEGIQDKMEPLTERFGRFPVMIAASVVFAAMFCNQVISVIMCKDLLGGFYEKCGASNSELVIDLENSAATVVAMVPWCLLCSVPLGFMQVGYGAMIYAVYIYAVPLCYILTKKRFKFNVGL